MRKSSSFRELFNEQVDENIILREQFKKCQEIRDETFIKLCECHELINKIAHKENYEMNQAVLESKILIKKHNKTNGVNEYGC